MEKILMEAKGINGQLYLMEDKIRIVREGVRPVLARGSKGEKDILISQISAVQFKKAALVAHGFIQFSFLGGAETKGRLFDAKRDENTVMFNARQQEAFEAIKTEIERRMSTSRVAEKATSASGLDELEKLASLRDKGIITQDEFNAKKRQILGT